jgi:hypothetical protein
MTSGEKEKGANVFFVGTTRLMAIKLNSCTKMETALSLLSIQKLQHLTLVHLEWKKRSHTNVTYVASVTRT